MPAPQIGSPYQPVTAYKDCQTGLLFFGLFQFAVAAFFVMLAVSAMWDCSLVLAVEGQRPSSFVCFLAGLPYLGAAVLLCCLGVGSIQCRRWARALLLILAWVNLAFAMSIMAIGGGVVILAPMLKCQPLCGTGMALSFVTLVLPGALAVGVASAMIAFYQNSNVKATCEARDPHVRWTDSCPLPLLAVSLALACRCVVICSCIFSGWHGALLTALHLGLCAYCAWAFYRQRVSGWWIILLTLSLTAIVQALTPSSFDPVELHQHMNLKTAQSEHAQTFLAFMLQWSWLLALPKIAYILYVKRFFSSDSSEPHEPC